MSQGRIVQIIGPVIDVEFPADSVPKIHDACEIKRDDAGRLVIETALHLGENVVRCVAMDSTDGHVRGMKVDNTNEPISVPVGPETLGRMLNVIGEPIDETLKPYSPAWRLNLPISDLLRSITFLMPFPASTNRTV